MRRAHSIECLHSRLATLGRPCHQHHYCPTTDTRRDELSHLHFVFGESICKANFAGPESRGSIRRRIVAYAAPQLILRNALVSPACEMVQDKAAKAVGHPTSHNNAALRLKITEHLDTAWVAREHKPIALCTSWSGPSPSIFGGLGCVALHLRNGAGVAGKEPHGFGTRCSDIRRRETSTSRCRQKSTAVLFSREKSKMCRVRRSEARWRLR